MPQTGQVKIGSSPRAWGILLPPLGLDEVLRFIPTCVGNTGRRRRTSLPPSVHPHVRGEYACLDTINRFINGSSPRAWGIHADLPGKGTAHRFIPTCVGNTWSGACTRRLPTVHPHVRGEYAHAFAHDLLDVGSSPRAWGIQLSAYMSEEAIRFIPTCVGNTPSSTWAINLASVHPHVRGEYFCNIQYL